jgi:hypothetical protein
MTDVVTLDGLLRRGGRKVVDVAHLRVNLCWHPLACCETKFCTPAVSQAFEPTMAWDANGLLITAGQSCLDVTGVPITAD